MPIFTDEILDRFRQSRKKNIKKRMAILRRTGVVDTTDPNNLKVEKEATEPIGEILTPLEQFRKENEAKKNKKKVKKIWDETEKSFRFRVRDPKKFKKDSFRTITFKHAPPKINAVIGKLKGKTTTTLQSLIFPKDEGWTLPKAKQWVKDHPEVKKSRITDEKMISVKCKEDIEKVEKIAMFVPFTRVDKEKKMVFGIATSEAVDSYGDIVRIKAIEKALPAYMEFGNIREMHQPSAVGVVKEHKLKKKEKLLWIGVKVSDDQAWQKVLDGVYKGFSIGGNILEAHPLKVKVPTSEIIEDEVKEKVLIEYATGKKKCKKDEPFIEVFTGGLEIVEIDLIEISLVDRPANPEALINSFKAANQQKEFVPEKVIILKGKKDVDLTSKNEAVKFKVSLINKSISENDIFNSLAKQLTMDKTLEEVMEAVFKYVKSQGVDLTDDNLSKAKSVAVTTSDFKKVIEALVEKTYSIMKNEDEESDDEEASDDDKTDEKPSDESDESDASDEEEEEEGQSDDEESDEEEEKEEEEKKDDKEEDVEKVLSSVVDKALAPLVKQLKNVETDVLKIKKIGKAQSTQKGITDEEAQEKKEEDVFKGVFGV